MDPARRTHRHPSAFLRIDKTSGTGQAGGESIITQSAQALRRAIVVENSWEFNNSIGCAATSPAGEKIDVKRIDSPYRRQRINVVLQAMDKAGPWSEPKLTVDGRATEIRFHNDHGAASMFGKPHGKVEGGL